ncbi:MAG TPA: hypothetical protein VK639_04565, partial [Terriglobales bacterium]|nr:hypothetical protein [Terriglobales bacterium]
NSRPATATETISSVIVVPVSVNIVIRFDIVHSPCCLWMMDSNVNICALLSKDRSSGIWMACIELQL